MPDKPSNHPYIMIWRRLAHAFRIAGIAATFGAMYAWAREQGLAVSEFRIDVGYTPSGVETEHDLYVGLSPAAAWRFL